MTSHSLASKNNIRQLIRSRRRALSRDLRMSAAIDIAERLTSLLAEQKANKIAAFIAQDGELDLTPTIQALWRADKAVYLPHLRPLPPNRLWFARFNPDTPMIKNRFGIPEPDTIQWIRVSQLDSVLMPLVAFDAAGHRLGMGGGFYDRSLSHLMQRKAGPKLIGIAFDQQEVDLVPTEKWDVPLDFIVTPSRVLRC